MKKKELIPAAIGAVLLGALAYLWLSPSGTEQAPSVTVTRLDGAPIALDDYRGRPLLVTFWATTCPTCVKEIPHLKELYHDLGNKGLGIVAVAMDYDPPEQVRNLVEQREVPYTVAMDSDGSAARAFGDVRLTPTTFLINPEGRVVQKKLGEIDMERLRRRVTAMLERV